MIKLAIFLGVLFGFFYPLAQNIYYVMTHPSPREMAKDIYHLPTYHDGVGNNYMMRHTRTGIPCREVRDHTGVFIVDMRNTIIDDITLFKRTETGKPYSEYSINKFKKEKRWKIGDKWDDIAASETSWDCFLPGGYKEGYAKYFEKNVPDWKERGAFTLEENKQMYPDKREMIPDFYKHYKWEDLV